MKSKSTIDENIVRLEAVEADYFEKQAGLPYRDAAVFEADARALDEALQALDAAIDSKRTFAGCLRLWARFIRLRDGGACVICANRRKIAAHHICRKSFMAEAALQQGNGITLCGRCHTLVHRGYNGRPDKTLPMNAQGGEKISIMEDLYGRLLVDGERRGLLDGNYYYLSSEVLKKFKWFQGFEAWDKFPGPRIEQAYLIWKQAPKQAADAILAANGFPNLRSRPPARGGMLIVMDDGEEAQLSIGNPP